MGVQYPPKQKVCFVLDSRISRVHCGPLDCLASKMRAKGNIYDIESGEIDVAIEKNVRPLEAECQ